ncbi:MAG: peptidoglycan DD-metalloendopeptidase family protein [Lachnospiraceae bacterium]|nr:peptidoglycan DD-metalloendopeptidase family protein [Lachnospiraceae bacterium]
MKRWKIITGMWLTGALVIGMGQMKTLSNDLKNPASYQVHAANETTEAPQNSPGASSDLQSQIDAAQKKQEQLKNQQSKLEKEIDHIQNAAGDVKKYIKSLDQQLNNLTVSIETNENEIADMEDQVEAVNQELELAQERQKTQYESMKLRIKYMYENSDNNYLQYLLESRSLADLFSREEYIEKITSYDKNLLLQYQSVLNEVSVAQMKAQSKLKEMEATREALRYQKKTVKRLIREKNRQVKIYKGQIQDSQQDVSDYAQQIASQEEEIEALLQKQRDKIAAQESQGGNDEKQVVPTTGDYAWPLTTSGRITSSFGYRSAPTAGASSYHKGVDIAVSVGTSVLATKDGKVVTATYSSSAGNYVAIYHGNGTYSYYMHCSSLSVSAGDRVKKGQVIAKSGSTGISTGPHLHFAIYKNGTYVNPMYYVSQP